jgi:Effector-associated domain 11
LHSNNHINRQHFMMDKPKIRQLIGANRLDEAIKELLKATEHTHHHNDVLLLSTRLNEYKSQQIKGIASSSELNQLRNQIADAMLSIINEFSEKDTPSVLDNANKFSWTKWTGLNDVKSWIAALAGLIAIYKFCGNEAATPLLKNVSVSVENKERDLIPELTKAKDAYVIMAVEGGDVKKEVIDEKGKAAFQNVKVGDKVRLKIDFSEPFRPLNPDSLYTIPADGRITLTAGLQHLNRVYGTVIWHEQPLVGVKVVIGDLNTLTDSAGGYNIQIPEQDQRKEQEVKFLKAGFKMLIKKAFPQTNEPLNIVMEK